MKGEDEISTGTTSVGGLASEAQTIEVEFIKTYEQLPVLWDSKHPDYTNKYRRDVALDSLVKIIKKWDSNATRLTVRQKINVLRVCYRKDLRKHLSSKIIGPDGEETYEYNPKSWKFYALRFLGGRLDEHAAHIQSNSIAEVNLDNMTFEEEAEEDFDDNEHVSNTSDIAETFEEDKTYKRNRNTRKKRKKRVKLELQEYFEDNTLDKEFEAIGANVSCKLKRMNVEQRNHAELLINKVLIEGLRNNLTDDTDLTEVYK